MKDELARYDRIVSLNPNFDRKGKTMIYTSSNGYMFSMLNKAGEMGIRLPKEVGKQFKLDYGATEYRSHGAVMRDYVKIPEDLLNDEALIGKYLQLSFEYVESLPPK